MTVVDERGVVIQKEYRLIYVDSSTNRTKYVSWPLFCSPSIGWLAFIYLRIVMPVDYGSSVPFSSVSHRAREVHRWSMADSKQLAEQTRSLIDHLHRRQAMIVNQFRTINNDTTSSLKKSKSVSFLDDHPDPTDLRVAMTSLLRWTKHLFCSPRV